MFGRGWSHIRRLSLTTTASRVALSRLMPCSALLQAQLDLVAGPPTPHPYPLQRSKSSRRRQINNVATTSQRSDRSSHQRKASDTHARSKLRTLALNLTQNSTSTHSWERTSSYDAEISNEIPRKHRFAQISSEVRPHTRSTITAELDCLAPLTLLTGHATLGRKPNDGTARKVSC